jgi:excisionase family DNA binding protein
MVTLTPIEHEPDLMTLDELARRLGWSYGATYEAARAGTLPIPVIKIGRRYMFSRQAWAAVVARQTEPATA